MDGIRVGADYIVYIALIFQRDATLFRNCSQNNIVSDSNSRHHSEVQRRGQKCPARVIQAYRPENARVLPSLLQV